MRSRRRVSSVRAASTDDGVQPDARAPTIMRRGTAHGRPHDGGVHGADEVEVISMGMTMKMECWQLQGRPAA